MRNSAASAGPCPDDDCYGSLVRIATSHGINVLECRTCEIKTTSEGSR